MIVLQINKNLEGFGKTILREVMITESRKCSGG